MMSISLIIRNLQKRNVYAILLIYYPTNLLFMDQILFWNFILAIALGALIGTEREMPRSGTIPGGASGFGGIISYALLSLL